MVCVHTYVTNTFLWVSMCVCGPMLVWVYFFSIVCLPASSFVRFISSSSLYHSCAFDNFLACWLAYSPHVDPSLDSLAMYMVDYVNIKWSTYMHAHIYTKTAKLTRSHAHTLTDWLSDSRLYWARSGYPGVSLCVFVYVYSKTRFLLWWCACWLKKKSRIWTYRKKITAIYRILPINLEETKSPTAAATAATANEDPATAIVQMNRWQPKPTK